MFSIFFADAAATRTATRKGNAVKIAERDGAVYITNPAGEVVWGEKPAAPATPTTRKSSERRPYRLDGSVAAADRAKAAEVAITSALLSDVEIVAAEEIEEGDIIVGRRAKDATREVAEVRIGKKWVTFYDAQGRAFGYVPLGESVPRLVEDADDDDIM